MICKFVSNISDLGIEFKTEVALSLYSSFKIGGPAAVMVFPHSKDELISVLNIANMLNVKYVVVGNGSNILFDDSGYDGVVISTIRMRMTKVTENVIWAECGASLTAMAVSAMKNSLTGLEFAYGIPGSCGGAVFMNAGAYGSEISAVIDSAECYDVESNTIVTLANPELDLSYRHSVLMDKNNLIILSATFILAPGDRAIIGDIMAQNQISREQKQPLNEPHAGSIFKRHDKFIVSKIIDECGLKGYRVGGAKVSEKHAGFIVNCGSATSSDVLDLIAHIKKTIFKKHGFEPECEMRYIR